MERVTHVHVCQTEYRVLVQLVVGWSVERDESNIPWSERRRRDVWLGRL